MMDSLAPFIRPPTIPLYIYLGASKIEKDGSWMFIPQFSVKRYNVFNLAHKNEYELERLAIFLLIVNILDCWKDLRCFHFRGFERDGRLSMVFNWEVRISTDII